MRDGNALYGTAMRTYRQYKTVLKTEYYIKQNMSRGHRGVLAKFHSCNLPFAVETKRFTRPKLPYLNDFVHIVPQNSVENEIHFWLIVCYTVI